MALMVIFLFILIRLVNSVTSAAVMHAPAASSTFARKELALPSVRANIAGHHYASAQLHRRDAEHNSVCGGDNSLRQCGAQFPSGFCCPESTTCLQLDSSAIAVLCCPAGLDCGFISPISCDEQAQNATLYPGNQLHSEPTMPLDQCGDACCPSGATCHNGVCAISTKSSASSTVPPSTVPTSAPSSSSIHTADAANATSGSSPSAATTQSAKALGGIALSDGAGSTSSDAFSGKSFVAGLFPGVVIGAIIVTLLVWCLDRRRKRHDDDHLEGYSDHKSFSTADQLTSLSTAPHRAMPTHTRSISEPISDPRTGHRTDFARGTPSPPRLVDPLNHNAGSYVATATGPITPARTPKVRALFSRSSIFQPPPSPQVTHLPSHLKRGTLTHAYTISPIRALRSKKSSHSLRRQMTASATMPTASHEKDRDRRRPRASTTGSEETIRVTMPQIELEAYTPDRRRLGPPVDLESKRGPGTHSPLRDSEATWATVSSSPLYPEPVRTQIPAQETPTRIPASQARTAGRALGESHLSPWRNDQGLAVPADARRQTTFSGFMEKAGIRPGGVL